MTGTRHAAGGLVSHGAAAVGLVALTTLALGCAEEPTEPDPDPWVEVGHGLAAFEPLAEEAPLEIVLGSQGGWHVDLASRFGGGPADGGFAVYRVWDPEHTEQISYPVKASLDHAVRREDGSFEQAGVRTVLAIDDPSEVVDRGWLIEVELLIDGAVTVDDRLATLVDDEP